MRTWDDIVNKATLGSAKQSLKSSDLPQDIHAQFDVQDVQDAEENFLRLAALALQYRQAGSQPLDFSATSHVVADAEINPYSTAKANTILKVILGEEHYPLLEIWLKLCVQKKWCVEPEIIPQLFDIAIKKKELRELVVLVTGNRGAWLSTFNPDWNFYSPATDQTTLWQTGRPEERRTLLNSLRESRPEQGVDLLKSTWPTEGVNEKVAFLEILKVNLSASDLPWLESLTEKGQKLNNAVNELLKLIPASAILQGYASILKDAINIKTGKALLGMISKKTLEINEAVQFPDSIFKTGIEKLSSNKNVSDNQYVLVQLICSIPPSFWNEHLQESSKDIIQLFQKEKNTLLYVPAFGIAAVKFKDYEWIKHILDYGDEATLTSSIVELIGALPDVDRDHYARKFFNTQPPAIIQVMLDSENEWSVELAKTILKYTADAVYVYNKTFYKAAIARLPVDVLGTLDSFIPADEQKKPYWKTQSDELSRLLSIKQQTLQSFIP